MILWFRIGLAAVWLSTSHARADPLTVAVYDVPPYGHVESDGTFDGASVDLWRRVAEQLGLTYKLVPAARMDALLEGVGEKRYDVAIGAITITPERLARVDFTYPAHRSGVAAVFRRERGTWSAMSNYGQAVMQLAPLILGTLALSLAMGAGLWWVERARGEKAHESAVATLRDGVYWAVTTMTTVGYGDKTPKTNAGRALAVFWMMSSVALVSVLSAAIVAKMTADQVSGGRPVAESDLNGKRLAAVEASSGAEYLDARRLAYAHFSDIPSALAALVQGDADAVVNSIGALQYATATGFRGEVDPPANVLVPAYMAFALPRGGELKARLDSALARVTASAEWRRVEASYFGP